MKQPIAYKDQHEDRAYPDKDSRSPMETTWFERIGPKYSKKIHAINGTRRAKNALLFLKNTPYVTGLADASIFCYRADSCSLIFSSLIFSF